MPVVQRLGLILLGHRFAGIEVQVQFTGEEHGGCRLRDHGTLKTALVSNK